MTNHPVNTLLNNINELRDVVEYQKTMGIDGFVKPKPLTLPALCKKITECVECALSEHRKNVVCGHGDPDADLMFIEDTPVITHEPAPAEENNASALLTKILHAINLERNRIYITPLVKCMTEHDNRPCIEEAAWCERFLKTQIESIRPTLICTLGPLSAQTLLKTSKPISQLRGKVHTYNNVRLIPTFHPEFLLKNPAKKREVWEDVKKIKKMLVV